MTLNIRHKARRLLLERKRERPADCMCIATREAHDIFEFREWMEEVRAVAADRLITPHDRLLAAVVRRCALREDAEPPFAYRRTLEAVNEVLAEERQRQREGVSSTVRRSTQPTRETDPEVAPFWRLLLGSDRGSRPGERLKAFVELDELGVLRSCTCEPLRAMSREEELDEYYSSTIRLMGEGTFYAAATRVMWPEAYHALVDSADEAILASRGPRENS